MQGHEDLRQDERVMQLFGLVNTMLNHDRTTAERALSIARYAVIPLSPNSGKSWNHIASFALYDLEVSKSQQTVALPLSWCLQSA